MEDFLLWHYDGKSATRRSVVPQTRDGGFVLADPESDWIGDPVAWSDLVVIRQQRGHSAYGHRDRPGWRIGFTGDAPPEFAALLPKNEHYGKWVDKIGLWPAVGTFATLAVVAIFVLFQSPQWLAPLVPQSWENNLGDAMIGDFGNRYCRTPESAAALQALVREIDPKGEARQVEIANIPMVNAITLPGGHILLFDGLVQAADSPDELAGVLGHELGHVRHRDSMAGLLRQIGVGLFLGGFGGEAGNTLSNLVTLSYGRKAEAAADGVAIERLEAADISPKATADFFAKLARKEGSNARVMSFLSSHPVSDDRRRRFETSVVAGRAYRSALTNEQWQAVRNACRDDPNVASPIRWVS
ncbi:M48 family metallopeptidase [Sphingosinithalassobacter portus]|uniref:M48 family metallopeptidase n=1 Tax=Stakelama portus TaxID=2676234 RepID=UPI000D6E1291|nr:M48 family metallopeptidase [Sphingosinithalassobacter portus]